MPARAHLWQIYRAALRAVEGRACTRAWLERHDLPDDLALIALGKAAAAMSAGALDALGARCRAGFVVSKKGDESHHAILSSSQNLVQMHAGHPIPDAESLRAGHALLAFIARQSVRQPLLFLLSGGTSSLVEVLPEGMELAHLQDLNRWLLGSGLDILRVNAIRQRFSCLKGGKLLAHVAARPTWVLLISDVPGDDLARIGSGLLYPSAHAELPAELPPALRALALPKPPAFTGSIPPHVLVATLDDALSAATAHARQLGYTVHRHGFLHGDAATVGREFARLLRQAPPGVHICGGETSVRLPPEPGHGGRNQHLALAAAIEIAGQNDVWILAAATDGTDGPTQDAGALIDGTSVSRMRKQGFDARACLAAFDSGTALKAAGDLLCTGPTGTNVMDLLIGLKK